MALAAVAFIVDLLDSTQSVKEVGECVSDNSL